MVANCIIILTHFSIVIAHVLQQFDEDKILYMIGGEEDDSYYIELERDEDSINIGFHAEESDNAYTDDEDADIDNTMQVRVEGIADGVVNINANYVLNY